MGTSSYIGKKNNDGSVRCISCHWDGYIRRGNGEKLVNFYSDIDRVDKLLDLGNLSFLGEEPIGDPKHWKYSLPDCEKNQKACCTYKDRGDRGEDAQHLLTVGAYIRYATDVDYTYLFEDGCWKVFCDGSFVPVETILKDTGGKLYDF